MTGTQPSAVPSRAGDTPLARRARWLMLGLTLPLVVVVLVLATLQYREQRRQVLHDLAVAGRAHAATLDTVARQARDHVAQMRAWSEGSLNSPPGAPSRLRGYFLPREGTRGDDGYTLDTVPAEQRRLVGQLLWFNGDPRHPASGQEALDLALEFFGLVRLTHDVTPYFQWSYYFPVSRDFVATYPWAPSAEVTRIGGEPTMRASVRKWFDYEIYTAGTPGANPQRQPYWTEPYIDAFGSGAMVSLGSPVYAADKFAGIVGTDVKLATLEELVRSLPLEVGRMWVLDAKGKVLSDSAGSGPDAIRSFADVRPRGVSDVALAAARAQPGSPQSASGHTLVAYALPASPWMLVYGVADAEITRLLLPRFVPYGVIVAILVLNFFVALYLLRRELINPAVALAGYIQRVSSDALAAVPPLPKLWRPVAATVSEALETQRESTRRLQQSEAFKAAIVDNAHLAVITMDAQWRIVEFNPAAEVIFGYGSDQVLGKELVEVLVAPAHRELYREGLRRYLAREIGGGSQERRDQRPSRTLQTVIAGGQRLGDRREVLALRGDGAQIPIEMSVSSTRVAGVLYFTAFAADMTADKKAEREIASQREALRQSEKLSAMGALLAGVAHELNNPLAILMGRAALLERKAMDPLVKSDALKIHAAADRCGRIVRTFLSMARQRPAVRRYAQLEDVVLGALDLVGYNLRSSGIEVEQQVASALPALEIDADQIGQVLVNLLVNAQQALTGRPEPRRVSLSLHATPEHVVLRVADNGPGVPEDIRERVFDPFFTTKVEGAGTGVGLSVSRAIVREHSGELRLLDASPGATFELELPVSAGSPAAAAIEDETLARMLPAGVALVVDDEADVAQVLCDILRSAGCTAVAVASGREALAWLADHSCSFILCDIRMPDMDGPALWRALHEQHPHMVGHLAFITGDTLSASVAPFLRETGLPSLEKPFTPEEVLELVAIIESV